MATGALRSGHGRGLQVVGVQVALQVEVRQRLALLHTQQGGELRVRHDGVLVLQVVLLHVAGDRLGHIGAGLLGAVGHAQERAQLVGQGGRDLEDGGLAGLGLLTLYGLLGLAAALVGLLLQAGHTLLQALQLAHQRAHRLAHGVRLGQHRLHIVLYGGSRTLSGLHGRGGHRSHHGRHHDGRRSHGRGLLGGGRGGRGLLRGGRRSGGRNGRSGSHRRGHLIGLLRHLLGLLHGGGRTHYTRCRGRIHGGNTHISDPRPFNFGSRRLVPFALADIFFRAVDFFRHSLMR